MLHLRSPVSQARYMHRLQIDMSVTARPTGDRHLEQISLTTLVSCQLVWGATSRWPPPQTRLDGPGLVLPATVGPVRDDMVTCRHHQSLPSSWLVESMGGHYLKAWPENGTNAELLNYQNNSVCVRTHEHLLLALSVSFSTDWNASLRF